MDKITELKNQIKEYEGIVRDTNIKIQNIKSELLTITKKETEQYYHKYIKYYPTDFPSYVHYLYVEACEHSYDDGWQLCGHGFISYIREDKTVKFETRSFSDGGLNLNNVEKGYDTVEFITSEEFYNEREKMLRLLMDERYSS